MDINLAEIFQTILIYALPVLFAITLHEAAHGYAALRLGDSTAYALGRITLNPIKHIDFLGTICIPLLLYWATKGDFLFGYAKPVPVNFGLLNNPKRDMVWVALAGPGANLFQALLWLVLFYLLILMGLEDQLLIAMCKAGVLVNIVMFVFNLFPLPPLDGGRITLGLLPSSYARKFARVEPYGFFVVMGLILAGVLNIIWMKPLMKLTIYFLDWVLTPMRNLIN